MPKFRVISNIEIEADDVDEAITKAAIWIAINASSKRPMMTVRTGNAFNFNETKEVDLLEDIQKAMFTNGEQIRTVFMSADPCDAFPAPEMTQ